MKKLIAAFCFSLVILLAIAPPAAQAGSKRLWPDQFTLSNVYHGSLAKSFEAASRSFYSLGAYDNTYPVTYDAEVKLPVGTKITKFAISGYSPVGARFITTLYRQRLGGGTEEIAIVDLSDWNPDDWYNAPKILLPWVKAGYRYWVQVHIMSSGAEVRGVKVSYE